MVIIKYIKDGLETLEAKKKWRITFYDMAHGTGSSIFVLHRKKPAGCMTVRGGVKALFWLPPQ